MKIDKYIQELLANSDCVIIPEFGGFVGSYKGAQIHPITHLFTPPSKTIAFNSKLISNDGYLIDTIASLENISKEEVVNFLNDFVSNINETINLGKQYLLEGIGTFKKNENGNIVFNPEKESFPTAESFGMTDFFAKPIERKTNLKSNKSNFKSMSTPENNPTNRPGAAPQMVRKKIVKKSEPKEKKEGSGALKTLLIILPIVLLLGTGTYFVVSHKNLDFASLNPINMMGLGNDETVEESIEAETTEVEEANEIAENTTSTESNAWETEEFEENNSLTTTETTTENDDVVEENVEVAVVEEYIEPTPALEVKELSFIDKILAWLGWGDEEEEIKEDIKIAEENGWADEESAKETPEEEVIRKENEAKLENEMASAKTFSNQKIISTKTNRYYVIAGAFENEDNANKYRNELESKGFDAKILVPRGVKNVHRVTIADFETQNEGILKSQSENEQFGFTLWVLKY